MLHGTNAQLTIFIMFTKYDQHWISYLTESPNQKKKKKKIWLFLF